MLFITLLCVCVRFGVGWCVLGLFGVIITCGFVLNLLFLGSVLI